MELSDTDTEDFQHETYRWSSASISVSSSINFNEGAGGNYGTTNSGGTADEKPKYKNF